MIAGSIFAVALVLLAVGCSAQELAFPEGPRIVSITPLNMGATIGFLPPKASENSPEILEYSIECSVPGEPKMGTAMFVYEDLKDTSADIYGLENGMSYTCVMFARGATDGLIPRGINSPPSNPTPIFSPRKEGGSTIYIESVEEPETVEIEEENNQENEETAGESVEVPPTEVETPIVLPNAPSIKTVSVDAEGTVEMIFSLPKGDESSPVTGFIGACQSNGPANSASAPVTVPAGSTAVDIMGLDAGEYTCSIAAQTADGLGKSATRLVTIPQKEQDPENTNVQQPEEPQVEKQDSEKDNITQPSAGFKPSVSMIATIFSIATVMMLF